MTGILTNVKIGIAFTGSFCTFKKVFEMLPRLIEAGAELTPIMSSNAYNIDTRFYSSTEAVNILEGITGRKVLSSINDVEPIGPKKLIDLLVIAPCTGNTLAKIANGIADTAVTMAVKSHLRNERPVLIGVSTNDGLAANAQNIGKLIARKHIYFIPFEQDDPVDKPSSLIFNSSVVLEACEKALKEQQLQPLLYK